MTAGPPIEITLQPHGDWVKVRISGDLDMAAAPAFEEACAQADGPLALDLSAVAFIDSSGLRSLIRLQDNGEVSLVAPSIAVRRLLDLTHLTDRFSIVDGFDELGNPE